MLSTRNSVREDTSGVTPMNTDVEIEAYDIKSFCKAFNVSRSFVYEEIKEGRLRVVKVGRRTLIPRPYALEWLHRNEVAPA
ncbi:MAG: hypothetical protein DHS20C05_08010 [Hyphococcus sp.]|nr:MAG: hypothetical protein DHS20C05_08010 [Marinicaulis sp.]